MAYEQPGFSHGEDIAGADLTAKQFFAVELGSGGYVLAGNGEIVDGILQNKPDSGEGADVMVSGLSKAVAGAAVLKGANVASDAAGKLVTAASGEYILGRAVTAAGADGDIFVVNMTRPGRLA